MLRGVGFSALVPRAADLRAHTALALVEVLHFTRALKTLIYCILLILSQLLLLVAVAQLVDRTALVLLL